MNGRSFCRIRRGTNDTLEFAWRQGATPCDAMTMNHPEMTEEAFAALLDACGGDPGRWPEDRRAAAVGLIAVSPVAKRAWQAAQALDLILAKAPVVAPSRQSALADRIVAAARVMPTPSEGQPEKSATLRSFGCRRARSPMPLGRSRPIAGSLRQHRPSDLHRAGPCGRRRPSSRPR